MGISVGYQAFTDPESRVRQLSRVQRFELYGQAWAYYKSEMFSAREGRDWSSYLNQRDLYKHTRLIYNPITAIVDFYVDNLWRPAKNEKFESLVTPVTPKTDEKLVAAIAQLDQWGNFLSESQKIKKYSAATGNVLIEGIHNAVRQKILHKTIWPGHVTDIGLSDTGDVTAYTIEYGVYDYDTKQVYTYKKVVTKETLSYFRNNTPFIPEGKTAEVEVNPYGFCFAVWIKHADEGSDYGQPACTNLDKIDEVNSLGSHLHDNIHKAVESPKVISSSGEIIPIIGGMYDKATGMITPSDPRLNWVVYKTPAGATVLDLAGSLQLADAHPYLKEILASFTGDYPELQAATIIKENSQLSGAALDRLLGPAQNRLNNAQAGYNQQLIKFRQMGVAVAGYHAANGWRGTSKQRDLFRPFSLDSYASGDLDFNLTPSVLVTETEGEIEDTLTKKAARAVTLQGIVDAQEQLNIAGFSEEQIKEIQARLASDQQAAAVKDANVEPDAAANNAADLLPPPGQPK